MANRITQHLAEYAWLPNPPNARLSQVVVEYAETTTQVQHRLSQLLAEYGEVVGYGRLSQIVAEYGEAVAYALISQLLAEFAEDMTMPSASVRQAVEITADGKIGAPSRISQLVAEYAWLPPAPQARLTQLLVEWAGEFRYCQPLRAHPLLTARAADSQITARVRAHPIIQTDCGCNGTPITATADLRQGTSIWADMFGPPVTARLRQGAYETAQAFTADVEVSVRAWMKAVPGEEPVKARVRQGTVETIMIQVGCIVDPGAPSGSGGKCCNYVF